MSSSLLVDCFYLLHLSSALLLNFISVYPWYHLCLSSLIWVLYAILFALFFTLLSLLYTIRYVSLCCHFLSVFSIRYTLWFTNWLVSCCLSPIHLAFPRRLSQSRVGSLSLCLWDYFSLRPSMIILAFSNPGWESIFPISSRASQECNGVSALDLRHPIQFPHRSRVIEIVSWS